MTDAQGASWTIALTGTPPTSRRAAWDTVIRAVGQANADIIEHVKITRGTPALICTDNRSHVREPADSRIT